MEGKIHRRLDGVYRLVQNPAVRKGMRRLGLFSLVAAITLGLFSASALPELTKGETGSASPNRIWSSGAELNSTTANMEFTDSSGTVSVSSSTKRSGDYSYRANPTLSTGSFYKTWASSAQSNKFWFRTYLQITDDPSADTYVMQVGSGTSGKISVRLTTSSTLQLRNEEDSTNIGSASSSLAASTWYQIEVYVDTTTLSSTDAEFRLDGVSISSSTAENLDAGIDRLSWGSSISGTTDLFFDDIAINDSTGRATDNWAGEGKIVHMNPDADGDNVAWTDSSGNSVDYDEVDEVTPDSDTTYLRTQTNNDIDDVNLESSSTVGVGANDRIKLTAVGVRYRTCGSTGSCSGSGVDITLNPRIKAAASGTVEEGSILSLDNTTTYYTNENDGIGTPLTTYNLPGTSKDPWRPANLDSAQIGVKNADSSGIGFRVTTLWLQVEYVPVTGGRIWSSGFELNSTTAGMEWTNSTGSPTISNSIFNGGAYSLDTEELNGSAEQMYFNFSGSNSDGTYYFRSYLRVDTSLASGEETAVIALKSTDGTNRAYVSLTDTNTLKLYDEDGLIGSASSALTADTWYRVEMEFNRNAGTNGTVTGRVNGSNFASSSTRSISTGVGRIAVGSWLTTPVSCSTGTCTGKLQFDDIALNQNIGSTQNSWPGAGKIKHLLQDGAGDTTSWSSHGLCSSEGCWSEVTPVESTYYAEFTSGDIQEATLGASGLSGETVNLVSVGARFTSEGAAESFKVRLKAASGGAVIESDSIEPTTTTLYTNQIAEPQLYPLTAYTRPDVSASWTPGTLDTAQVGVRDIEGSGTVRVATVWMMVDYTDAAVSVSGTIYSDEGSSVYNCSSNNLTVHLSLAGGANQSTTCTAAGGTYSITLSSPPSAAGDPIVVFIDSGETPKATTATLAANTSSNITGLNLYENRVILRHENAGPMTNAKLSTGDNANAGIRYAVSGANSTFESGMKLLVWTGMTFTPGGTVTTTTGSSPSGDLGIQSSATLSMGGNALVIGGSYANSGTFTSASNTTTFSATTTGKTLSGTLNGSSSFYNLIFNGVSGGWTFSAAVAVTNDFQVTNGAVASGNNNLTVTRDFILDNTSGVSYDGGSSTVRADRHWTDSGNKYTEGTSTVSLQGTGTLTSGGNLYSLSSGYTSQTTTWASSMSIAGVLTFNGGIVTRASGFNILNTAAAVSTPVVFASATTLSGTNTLAYDSGSASRTINVTSANYGTWRVEVTRSHNSVTSTFAAGTLTTTGGMYLASRTGTTGGIINLNGATIQLTNNDMRIGNGTGELTVNADSSSVTVEGIVFVSSTAGTSNHTLNLNTSTWTVLSETSGEAWRNCDNVACTVHLTVNPGTSTVNFNQTFAGVLKDIISDGQSFHHVGINSAAAGTVGIELEDTFDVNGNLTIGSGDTLDTKSGENNAITLAGSYTNSGTFTARSGTVTLNGSSTQTMSGTMTSTSAFYNLTITNNSGASPSDCELTGFTASVDFEAANATVTNNYTITTSNVRVQYDTGNTYTFNNINWVGAASNLIIFRNSAASGTWLLNVSGTQTVSYVNVSRSDASGGNEVNAEDGTNTNCNNNTNWSFTANANPNVPTALDQLRTTLDTTIAVGGWTNETQVTFEATASDSDNPDTLQLCVETVDISANFSNTETACGSGVAYSGTPVTVSVTISGQTDATEYYWQARVKDAAGSYSNWVDFGGNSVKDRDYGIDTTACTYGGAVYDGTTEDVDVDFNDGSLSALSANWDAFSCGVSGLSRYDYSIGTTVGGTDVKTWTNNSTTESVTATSLNLHTNQHYFVNVRAVDNAANTSGATTSDGQDVLATISMSLGATTIAFSNLNGGNDLTDSKTLTLTTSTNAYGGYVIRQYANSLLTAGSNTIPMFQAGSYATPAAWPSGACTAGVNCGYGYTSSDTTIQGSNKFSSGTLFAAFAMALFGDIVADHTAAVTGATGPVTNEQFTITHKVSVGPLQPSAAYQAEVLYIVTGTF